MADLNAKKKNYDIKDNYNINDMFETQDALDDGILGSVVAGTRTTYERGTGWLNENEISGNGVDSDAYANKDTLGSMLGMTDQIALHRKRRNEQRANKSNGFDLSSSVLGGGGF